MSFNPLVPSRNRQLRSDPFALLQNEIDVLFDDFGRGFFQTRSGSGSARGCIRDGKRS